MLTTSISLPLSVAQLWRRNQRAIMKIAIRTFRLQMRRNGVRRGVKRAYNRQAEDYSIVTTRFTEAEYDALHFVAASLRVSVSWLIYRMILVWQKPARRVNQYVTNYDINICIWHQNAGVCTESLLFWKKNPYNANISTVPVIPLSA
jgi:hypothetical protein